MWGAYVCTLDRRGIDVDDLHPSVPQLVTETQHEDVESAFGSGVCRKSGRGDDCEVRAGTISGLEYCVGRGER